MTPESFFFVVEVGYLYFTVEYIAGGCRKAKPAIRFSRVNEVSRDRTTLA